MAITYPRPLPGLMLYSETAFDLDQGTDDPVRFRGGAVQVANRFHPSWRARFSSPSIFDRNAVLELKTWFDTLRGGGKTFLAHDQARPRPKAYATDAAITSLTRASVGGAFDGTFEITSFPDAYGIACQNAAALRLPNGFTMTEGDYIGIVQSGRYSLHRVTETISANGNGNYTIASGGVRLEPFAATNIFTAGAIANVIKPLAQFIPVPGSFEGDPSVELSSVSFAGVSVI